MTTIEINDGMAYCLGCGKRVPISQADDWPDKIAVAPSAQVFASMEGFCPACHPRVYPPQERRLF